MVGVPWRAGHGNLHTPRNWTTDAKDDNVDDHHGVLSSTEPDSQRRCSATSRREVRTGVTAQAGQDCGSSLGDLGETRPRHRGCTASGKSIRRDSASLGFLRECSASKICEDKSFSVSTKRVTDQEIPFSFGKTRVELLHADSVM